jgi:hypothetical protein
LIRFECPTCGKRLKAPDDGAGCKTTCTRCSQRLLVPPRVQNKTVLGKAVPDRPTISAVPPSGIKPQAAVLPPGQVVVSCPGCGRAIQLRPHELSLVIECAACNLCFSPSGPPVPPPVPRQWPSGPSASPSAADDDVALAQAHSGLGIASFILALLVGGLDVMLAVMIATRIAHSAPRSGADLAELKADMLTGGMAMACLNFMSVPLCLVGVGLAFVGLIAHRDRNHLFNWIGLFGNGVVIFGVLAFWVYGESAQAKARQQERAPQHEPKPPQPGLPKLPQFPNLDDFGQDK